MGIMPAEAQLPIADARPLHALLSQVLVAFTVEFDNEFERRMVEAGYPGALLSLTAWANVMRFVGDSGITVRDLAARALAPDNTIKFQLACLERWSFVAFHPHPIQKRREGGVCSRGIRTA